MCGITLKTSSIKESTYLRPPPIVAFAIDVFRCMILSSILLLLFTNFSLRFIFAFSALQGICNNFFLHMIMQGEYLHDFFSF